MDVSFPKKDETARDSRAEYLLIPNRRKNRTADCAGVEQSGRSPRSRCSFSQSVSRRCEDSLGYKQETRRPFGACGFKSHSRRFLFFPWPSSS